MKRRRRNSTWSKVIMSIVRSFTRSFTQPATASKVSALRFSNEMHCCMKKGDCDGKHQHASFIRSHFNFQTLFNLIRFSLDFFYYFLICTSSSEKCFSLNAIITSAKWKFVFFRSSLCCLLRFFGWLHRVEWRRKKLQQVTRLSR